MTIGKGLNFSKKNIITTRRKTVIIANKQNNLQNNLAKNNKKYSSKSNFLDSVEFDKIANIFSKKYPELFSYSKPLTLSIGIHKDLKQDNSDLSNKLIKKFLFIWCSRNKYKKATKINGPRYNLLMKITSYVTKEQVKYDRSNINKTKNSYIKKKTNISNKK